MYIDMHEISHILFLIKTSSYNICPQLFNLKYKISLFALANDLLYSKFGMKVLILLTIQCIQNATILLFGVYIHKTFTKCDRA